MLSPAEDEAGGTHSDLGADVGAVIDGVAGHGEEFFPLLRLHRILEQRIGDGQAGFFGELRHPREFVFKRGEVGGHFEDSEARGLQSASDSDELIAIGEGAWDRDAIFGQMEHRARGGKPERAGADTVFDDFGHLSDVVLVRGFVVGAALSHDVGAHGAMRDVGCDVDRARLFVERVEIFGEALPIPFDAFGECGPRDIFDPFHEPDEPFVLIGFGGSEPDAAIPHDDGCDSVPAGGGHVGVPSGLAVVVGVDIDPAWGDEVSVGVDFAFAFLGDIADSGDFAVKDGDIAVEGGLAGAVDDFGVADNEVVHFDSS